MFFMKWQLLLPFLVALSVSSCQKNEKTTIAPTIDSPKSTTDSPKVFVPYSVNYLGRMHNYNGDESFWMAPVFDTVYNAVLTVKYPDTLHLNFHLAFWDVNNASGRALLFYNETVYRYARSPSNTYADDNANGNIHFTIRGDSVLVRKFVSFGCGPAQEITFAGKRP